MEMEGDAKLRDEVLAFHAAQRELMKWKLVGIGALGAIALGVPSPSTSAAGFVICLAPFLAAYCDLLCREYDLRVAISGAFLRSEGDVFAKYERFVNSKEIGSTRWWLFRKVAAVGCSIVACILTAVVGWLLAQRAFPPDIFSEEQLSWRLRSGAYLSCASNSGSRPSISRFWRSRA
jgi:hypothetical protein